MLFFLLAHRRSINRCAVPPATASGLTFGITSTGRLPAFARSLSSASPGAAYRHFLLMLSVSRGGSLAHLRQCLINGEAGSFLARRKLPERLHERDHDCLRR